MESTQRLPAISTKLQLVAKQSRKHREEGLTNLAHHIDVAFLRHAFYEVRKGAAPGIDGKTWEDYAKNLDENLKKLVDAFKSGRYKAPPVKRVMIAKPEGGERPLGLPTIEDKVLQKAVAMVLQEVYEVEFFNCSYGFRPHRSAHDAIKEIMGRFREMGSCTVLEADIQKFFDTLDFKRLNECLDERVKDGVIRRVIQKWLKAGVMDGEEYRASHQGSPQGGVISPLLANIYLHVVVDRWFEETVKPRLEGKGYLIRYADDFVMMFEKERDAKQVEVVLWKRCEKYGLALHPDKTQRVKMRPKPTKEAARQGKGDQESRPQGNSSAGSRFDYLGFTFFFSKSRRGRWVVKLKTAKSRLKRSLARVKVWCKKNRHLKLKDQIRRIKQQMVGYMNYFGVSWNYDGVKEFVEKVKAIWLKWLNRRSDRPSMTWDQFATFLAKHGFPKPCITYHLFTP
jgi:group II intron reverse transcriptase/maturase